MPRRLIHTQHETPFPGTRPARPFTALPPLDADVAEVLPELDAARVRNAHGRLIGRLAEAAAERFEADGLSWLVGTGWTLGFDANHYSSAPYVTYVLCKGPRPGRKLEWLLDGEVAMSSRHHQPRWFFVRSRKGGQPYLAARPTIPADADAFWSAARMRGAELVLPDGSRERVVLVAHLAESDQDTAVRLAELTAELERLEAGAAEEDQASRSWGRVELDIESAHAALLGLGPLTWDDACSQVAERVFGIDLSGRLDRVQLTEQFRKVLNQGLRGHLFDRPKQRGWVRAIVTSVDQVPSALWQDAVRSALEQKVELQSVDQILPGVAQWLLEVLGFEVPPRRNGLLEHRTRAALGALVAAGEVALRGVELFRLVRSVFQVPPALWESAVEAVLEDRQSPVSRAALAEGVVEYLEARDVSIVPFHDGAWIGEQIHLALRRGLEVVGNDDDGFELATEELTE